MQQTEPSQNHSINEFPLDSIAVLGVASVTTQVIGYVFPAVLTAWVCTGVKTSCFRAVSLHAHSIVQPATTTVCVHWLSHNCIHTVMDEAHVIIPIVKAYVKFVQVYMYMYSSLILCMFINFAAENWIHYILCGGGGGGRSEELHSTI